MARIATLLLASVVTPVIDISLYNLNVRPALTNGIAANGDYVPVATIQRNGRLIGCDLRVAATLGAGATVKASLYRAGVLVRDLTIATTAGGASYVNSNTLGPIDVLAGDEIVLVVGGANITAAAAAEIDVQLQH